MVWYVYRSFVHSFRNPPGRRICSEFKFATYSMMAELNCIVTYSYISKLNMSAELRSQSPATVRKPVQCWALCRNKQRCKAIVKSREGEPIPIPYCNRHLKCGDYALRVVEHPFAGKCIVARFDLPPKYRMAFHGIRGKCPTSDKEDRSISFYPPNQKTGSNYYPNTRTLKNDNYNGVLNPKHTSDILQYAANPGKNERQNCRSVSSPFGNTTLATFVDSFMHSSLTCSYVSE